MKLAFADNMVADNLQPASTISYNENLVVNATGQFNSLKVGKQGVGGVTFFNGTIINSTTGANKSNNPVTFGDNVRIDGEIYRTEKGGKNPLKISDNIVPTLDNTNDFGSTTNAWKNGYFDGTLTTGTLAASALSGTGIVNSTNLLDATIATADLADSAVTSAKITDGTIASGDIADSAVTTGKIADGTITGDDINSSTTLTIKDVSWSTPKTKYTTFDGSSCVGQGVMIESGTYSCKGDGATAMSANWEVNLPELSTVTNFASLVTDNDGVVALGCSLRRRLLSDGSVSTLAQIDTTSFSGTIPIQISSSNISYGTINNYDYSYFIHCGTGATTTNIEIFGSKITYVEYAVD